MPDVKWSEMQPVASALVDIVALVCVATGALELSTAATIIAAAQGSSGVSALREYSNRKRGEQDGRQE